MSDKPVHIVFQVLNFLHSPESTSLNLTDAEKLLLLNLASHKGIKGIYPAGSTIAFEMKKGKSTVWRLIKKLKSKGLISILSVVGKSNHYQINLSTAYPISETSITPDLSHPRDTTYLTHEIGTYLTGETLITKGNNKRIKERGRKKRATPLSEDFEISKESCDKAQSLGLTEEEANDELDKFMNYYIEKGEEKTDWNLVLQNWFIRSAQYKSKNGSITNETGVTKNVQKSTVPEYKTPVACETGNRNVAAQHLSNIMNKLKLNGGSPNGLGSQGKGEIKGSG